MNYELPPAQHKNSGQNVRFELRLASGVPFLVPMFLISTIVVLLWLIAGHGLPALRHDWSLALGHVSSAESALNAFWPWQQEGIGQPNSYPLNFIFGIALAVVGLVAGPWGQLLVILLVTVVTAWLLARTIEPGSHVVHAAITLIVLFNPWTYTQLTAGHLYMPLACFACIALFFVAASQRSYHRATTVVLIVFAMQQMQFLLPAFVAVAYLAARKRDLFLGAAIVALTAPIWVSIALNNASLSGIPFLLAWEDVQSVAWTSAAQLGGYSASYAPNVVSWSGTALCLFSLAALLYFVARREERLFVGATVACVIALLTFVSGTTGVFARSFDWLVLHIHVAGVYREVYDLLGILAVLYASVLAHFAHRTGMRLALLIAALSLPLTWFLAPPSAHFISLNSFGTIDSHSVSPGRYALMPPFQPLTFDGRGHGLDPQAVSLPQASIVNSPFPRYPAQAALARGWQHHDYSWLAALGVGTVVERRHFASDPNDMRTTWAMLPPRNVTYPYNRIVHIAAAPILSYTTPPKLGTVDFQPGSGNVFIGDASCDTARKLGYACFTAAIHQFSPSIRNYRADKDWVSIALAGNAFPEVAQAWSGVVTTSKSAELDANDGEMVLAFVRGALLDQDGTTLFSAKDSHYHWHLLPRPVKRFRCLGLCSLAAQGRIPRDIPENPPSVRASALSYKQLAPWCLITEIPAGAHTLRFLAQYDGGWIALSTNGALVHVPLDHIFNGWLVGTASDQLVAIVNLKSVCVACLEVIALLVLVLFTLPIPHRRKERVQ